MNLLKNRAELPVERCDISVAEVEWYFYTSLHFTKSNSPVVVFFPLSSSTVFQSLLYYLIILIFDLGFFRGSSNDDVPFSQGLQSCMHSLFFSHNLLPPQK